jgi:hypothetical protein
MTIEKKLSDRFLNSSRETGTKIVYFRLKESD